MTTDSTENMLQQIKHRLLDKMGESGEIDSGTIIIRGITQEEWDDSENRSLLFDEPDIDTTVEEENESNTYTAYINIISSDS